MTAQLVAKLTDAIAELVPAIGIKDTRKLLLWLAEGLGAPEEVSAPSVIEARPEPGPE